MTPFISSRAGQYTPTGRILVHNDTTVYGFGRKRDYFTWVSPLEYHLFSADKSMQIEAAPFETKFGNQVYKAVRPAGKIEYRWSNVIPLQARAMAMAGKTLFIAGPPDIVDEEEALKNLDDAEMQSRLAEQSQALEDQKGAIL